MALSPKHSKIEIKAVTYHIFFTLRSLFWGIVMMVFQRVVTDDIVIHKGVSLRPEVPWLLLGVVWPVFETTKLVFEIQNVVRLLIPEGAILVLS